MNFRIAPITQLNSWRNTRPCKDNPLELQCSFSSWWRSPHSGGGFLGKLHAIRLWPGCSHNSSDNEGSITWLQIICPDTSALLGAASMSLLRKESRETYLAWRCPRTQGIVGTGIKGICACLWAWLVNGHSATVWSVLVAQGFRRTSNRNLLFSRDYWKHSNFLKGI